MKYNFKLSVAQVNEIIGCMREGPYWRVNNIIQDLNKQLQDQLQVKGPETPVDPPQPPAGQNGASPDGPH